MKECARISRSFDLVLILQATAKEPDGTRLPTTYIHAHIVRSPENQM